MPVLVLVFLVLGVRLVSHILSQTILLLILVGLVHHTPLLVDLCQVVLVVVLTLQLQLFQQLFL